MNKLWETLKRIALGGQGGHPLAHVKEAEAVFDELRSGDAVAALAEITHWLESVTHDPELRPGRRFDLIKRLDDLAQPHRIKVGRDHGSLSRQSRFQQGKLWSAKHDYWTRVAEAYADLIARIERKDKGTEALKAHHGMIAVRALRASARRLKWLHLRYGPVPADMWRAISHAYQFADARKVAQTRLTLYPGIPGDSSPEEELLRAALQSASAPDALTPQEMEVCERVIAHFAGRFRVTSALQSDSSYWFDLEQGRQPLRLAAPPTQMTPGLRFFATVAAHADVMDILGKLDQSGALPADIDFGGKPDAGVVREVFRHLSVIWAPKPPVRKAERQRMQARMSIAYGFERVRDLMRVGSVDIAPEVSAAESETWVVDNVSVGGFGATIAQVKGDWLKIGSLLAVQPDVSGGGNGRWDLALVRRLSRDGASGSKGQTSTGVQIMSRTAVTAPLTNAGGAWGDGNALMDGIYLADPAQPGMAVLVLPAGAYLPGEQIQAMLVGRKHLLFPVNVIERGDDYDMVSFRDMVQEE